MTSKDTGSSAAAKAHPSVAWEEPKILAESRGGKLYINEETAAALTQVHRPVSVVGIAGLYRTGKSYLLNVLAGRKGFRLGSATTAETHGIWVWCVDHPSSDNVALLLMDTEGLGDIAVGDPSHDISLFTLSVLLSNTLVYNSKGTIDNDALEKINFVTKLADKIKVSKQVGMKRDEGEESEDEAGDEETEELKKVFPSFIWTVRDFSLDLTQKNPKTKELKSITADDYLETALKEKKNKGLNEEKSALIMKYNLPRRCIKAFFQTRNCFVFPSPVGDEAKMKHLEDLPQEDIKPTFWEAKEKFKEHIYTTAMPKTVNGMEITGRVFAGLARSYIDAVREGGVPCIESAVDSLARQENSHAISDAVKLYQTRLGEVQKPMTVEELSAIHRDSEEAAIASFLSAAVFDKDHEYQKELAMELDGEYTKACRKNEEKSVDKCKALLEDLAKGLNEKVKAGKYMVPGGYKTYREDLSGIEEEYKKAPSKGVKSIETWNLFLLDKRGEQDQILEGDNSLTEAKRKEEEERQRKEDRERQKREEEEARKRREQEEVDRKHAEQENIRQVEKKVQEEIAQLKKEQEMRMEFQKREADDKLKIKGLEERVQKQQDDQMRALEEKLQRVEEEAKKKKVPTATLR